jgi:phosphohistidine swiveling domain-containing protein
MKIPLNKKWVIIEKEDYANYLFVASAWESFTIVNKKFGFENCDWLAAEYDNKACTLFLPLDSYQVISKKFLETIFSNPGLWDNLHQESVQYARKLKALADDIRRKDFKNIPTAKIINHVNNFEKAQIENHARRGPMFMVEAKDNLFSNYLIEYLKERAADLKIKTAPAEPFRILITPTGQSVLKEQKIDIIRIALLKNKKIQDAALKRHAKKYEWLEYGLQGRKLNLEYFKNELRAIGERGARKLKTGLQNEKKILKLKQAEIINRFGIHSTHQKLFKVARDSTYAKAVSKDAQFYSYFATENLFLEIGRRINLSLEQIRFLTFSEIKKALLSGKDFSELANRRMKYSLHFSDKGKTLFFNGDAARDIRKKIKFVIDEKIIPGSAEELKGNSAFQGKAVGKVKIINTPQEMIKMHQGNILVSHMTNPDIVPVMKMAGAIVTDLGGITCHAAIVARELKTPCVVGTKIATKVLKDGDKVEVDADKGIVKIIK